jgi:hypothetical protein
VVQYLVNVSADACRFYFDKIFIRSEICALVVLQIKWRGPREGIRDAGRISPIFLGFAKCKNGIQKIICEVSANGDIGYVETSKWASQAAFTLLDLISGKRSEIKEGGGVLTTASCLGIHLRELSY